MALMETTFPKAALILLPGLISAACGPAPDEPGITLVIAGQALIKEDPRLNWENPFGSLKPILQDADVAFTNFEMAVISKEDRCGLPEDYVTFLGQPSLSGEGRPGNTGQLTKWPPRDAKTQTFL